MSFRTRTLVTKQALFVGTVTLAGMASPTASQAAAALQCFLRGDSQSLSYEIIHQAPQPVFNVRTGDYPESSAFYPASTYGTANIAALQNMSPASPSGFQFGKQYWLWGNRCIYMQGITPTADDCRTSASLAKGNWYSNIAADPSDPTLQLRPAFSTYDRANRCTLIQAGRVLGQSMDVLSKKATGLTIFDSTDRGASLQNLATTVTLRNGAQRNYLVDVCILEPTPMAADATGLFIDWEVQDNRLPAETYYFFQQMKGVVTNTMGKQFSVFTNDLSTSGPKNGIDATNVRQIINLVAGFAPIVWSGATQGNSEVELQPWPRRWTFTEDWKRQLDIMTSNGQVPLRPEMKRKVLLSTSIYDMTLDEARALGSETLQNQYRGILFWRNFAQLGGDCSRTENQVVACLAFGVCDGNYHQ